MTAPHLRGRLHDAANWNERMAQMRARTAEHVSRQRAQPAQPRVTEPAVVDPLACDADCPECGGDGMTVDHTESAKECSRYRARKIMAEGTNL